MSKASLACETCKHYIPQEFAAPLCARTKTVRIIPAKVYKEERQERFDYCVDERNRDFPGCGVTARHWEPNWWERNHAPAKMAVVCVLVTLVYALLR